VLLKNCISQKIKIGYPDKWKDYSALVIKSPEQGGTYFENTKT
jgi:endothelin-converting enzyme/putative endopeptidase